MVHRRKLDRRFSNRIQKFHEKLYDTVVKLDKLTLQDTMKLNPLFAFYMQVKQPTDNRLLDIYNSIYFGVDDYVNKTLRGK